MRSLFFLGGASLISGLEARLRFAVARDDAVLLATPRIAEAVNSADWKAHRLVVTKPRGRNRLVHAAAATAALADFISRHGPFGDVYLADLTTAMRLAALMASPARVTVLDDGLFAPSTAAERRLLPLTVGERVLDPPRVRFFSAFELHGRACDELLENDYRSLRERTQVLPSNDEDWIIGQPLVESGVVTQEDMRCIVSSVAAGLNNPVYICHPAEKPAVTERICGALPVRRFRLPLEIELLRGRSRPETMSGFYSSGLVQPMFVMGGGLPVVSYRIPDQSLRRAHEPIERAYEALGALTARHPEFRVADLANGR